MGWVTCARLTIKKIANKAGTFTKFDVDFILQIFKEYIIHNFYVPRMEHNNITLQPPWHPKDRFPGGEIRVGSRDLLDDAWYSQKNIDCAEFMRVRFYIDSDSPRMSVWIYGVRNTNSNIHSTWIVYKPNVMYTIYLIHIQYYIIIITK